MAKYEVTYTCGHSDTIQLYGKGRDREWKLRNEESKLCPECYKKYLTEERNRQNTEAAEANQFAGLPVLEGTESQIAWAESIRKEILANIEKQILSRITEEKKGEQLEAYNRVVNSIELIKLHTNASWWIDRRFKVDIYSLQDLIRTEIEAAKKATAEPPKKIIEAANAEATVYPEKTISNLVAEISIRSEIIEVYYPERNETFRELMYKLNLRWDNGWKRKFDKFNGSASDRIAEIGNKILLAGFPVRIFDNEIRQKAINGDYISEPTRWVAMRSGGDFSGWLDIFWGRNEDFYKEAKRIAGSRWSKPSVVVPMENYAEVLDFAEINHFLVSDVAKEMIEKAKKAKENALVTGVKVPKSLKHENKKLEIPSEVAIADEFRDQD